MTVERYKAHVYRCGFKRSKDCAKEQRIKTLDWETARDADFIMGAGGWSLREGLWCCPACREVM